MKTKTADDMRSIYELSELVTRLEDRIAKISGALDQIERNPGYRNHKPAAEAKIISFPESGIYLHRTARPKTENLIIKALPGMELPSNIPDFRPVLQRKGLILLAWDKRKTEMGDRFTAYWVTSTGTARFYASKQYAPENFFQARPDRKSYAAEDGIEFYGQEAPACLVHVAPELMKCNPRHGELRQVHITALRRLGSNLDFNYKYLLTNEKPGNIGGRPEEKQQRAGA